MLRRDFITLAGAGLLGTGFNPEAFGNSDSGGKIKWIRKTDCRLLSQVECDQEPFNRNPSTGVLDVIITFSDQEKNQPDFRLSPGKENITNNQVNASLIHKLHKTGPGPYEDLLEAILKLRNTGNTSRSIDLSFVTSAHSSEKFDDQHVYIPVSAAGLFKDTRHASIGSQSFVTDCDQQISRNSFECNYLEPMAGNPLKRKTKALILAPVIDSFYPGTDWRVSLFTESEYAYEFKSEPDFQNIPGWSAGKRINLNPGEEKTYRCFLHIHQGDSYGCWSAFHKFGHGDRLKVPDWLREIRVHYYDFLSSANGEKGHRGDGYESDMQYFREYHVGLATQHGYYHAIGDFIQP